jgi:1-acyl-sn-glycerol-3-phosphate acyltransferase
MNSRFSPAAVGAFELLFRRWMRRRVRAVRITGLPASLPPARPLLLAANHVSWWDGFVLREVQRALRPGAPLYTLMSSAELERLPFFRLLGVVGIDGGSPGTLASALRFLRERLRERPDSVIVLFPQGRIWPSHRRPLGFRPGVELFARRLGPVVVPVGVHAEPLNAASPTYFASVGEPCAAAPEASGLERSVEAQLDAVLAFLAEHGEDAPRHWPAPHWHLAPARDPVPEPT